MKIKLPYVESIDSYSVPENLEEIVHDSFRQFTKGTAKEYQYIDKLLYIDNLRENIHGNVRSDEAVTKIIGERVQYELSEYGEMPDKEDVLSIEFMQICYGEGFRPLKDGKFKYNTEELISNIIKHLMNYEVTDD